MALVLQHSEIDLEKLYLGKPKKDESGKFYTSPVSYNYGPLYIQSAKIKLNDVQEKENGDCFFTFEIVKDNGKDRDKGDGKDASFYKSCKDLELKFIDTIEAKSEKWFEKKLPREFITSGYRSIFTENETSVLLTLPFKPTLSKKNLTGVFNQYKKPMFIKEIKKNSVNSVVIIIEPICLKIGKKNIEACWQVVQMEIKVPRPIINTYAIRQHSDDEFEDYTDDNNESEEENEKSDNSENNSEEE